MLSLALFAPIIFPGHAPLYARSQGVTTHIVLPGLMELQASWAEGGWSDPTGSPRKHLGWNDYYVRKYFFFNALLTWHEVLKIFHRGPSRNESRKPCWRQKCLSPEAERSGLGLPPAGRVGPKAQSGQGPPLSRPPGPEPTPAGDCSSLRSQGPRTRNRCAAWDRTARKVGFVNRAGHREHVLRACAPVLWAHTRCAVRRTSHRGFNLPWFPGGWGSAEETGFPWRSSPSTRRDQPLRRRKRPNEFILETTRKQGSTS